MEPEPESEDEDQHQNTDGGPESHDQKQDRKPDRELQEDLSALFSYYKLIIDQDPFDLGDNVVKKPIPAGIIL